jgi:exonuclease VII small subunit
MDIPLGDLIYDLIHAVALDDEVEILEAAMALSKVAQKKIEDRTLEGSPSIAIKLQRVRKRLKAALEGKGFDAEPARATKSKAKDDDDDGLPSLDWTPDEED